MATTTFSTPLHLLHHSAFSSPTKTHHISFSTRVTTQSTTPLVSSTNPSLSSQAPKKKVLVPVGMGTEEMEAVVLVDVLRRAGADVTIASVGPELEVSCSSGTRLVADSCITECAQEVFDLIALPGGMPGSAHLRDCKILEEITRKQAEGKRLYGAICAAPAMVLVPWGLHKRKYITGHPAFKDKLPTFLQVEENVQVSGEMTTSKGPGTSFQFALSFVHQLFGSNLAQEIGHSLLVQKDCGYKRVKEFNQYAWSFDRTPKVLIPVANGCEEMEIVILVDILRRAKIEVIIASMEKKMHILGSQEMKIIADKSISEASKSSYDLIILPGGVDGGERLGKSRVLKKLLKEQTLARKAFGGTQFRVLENLGLLEEKITKAHPCVAGHQTGQMDEARVIIDGNLIAGKGYSTVVELSLAIIKKFFGQDRARWVACGLVYTFS